MPQDKDHSGPELSMEEQMARTTKAAAQLRVDVVAVLSWYDVERPGRVRWVEIQRHYSCEDFDIAHVEPSCEAREVRREARHDLEKALEALGWRILPEGKHVHGFFASLDSISAHKRLSEARRVRKALTASGLERSPGSD
ncbi:hypothetical protein [Pseudooceanicola onchidii]|uniref:hypothetical protein n=1 Tax=Pseudooceanicola onchidii TaxID=2562279 RepID=UPI0010AA48AA|nr:hypothetical protein [Pseudooceanicola onchidii]